MTTDDQVSTENGPLDARIAELERQLEAARFRTERAIKRLIAHEYAGAFYYLTMPDDIALVFKELFKRFPPAEPGIRSNDSGR